jgi:hypothetical protein
MPGRKGFVSPGGPSGHLMTLRDSGTVSVSAINTNPKRQFGVALFSVAPKGQRQISLGQRPRNRGKWGSEPCKGETSRRPCCALSGLGFRRKYGFPGRCSGLFCSAPSGKKTEQRNIKTGASGWYELRAPPRNRPLHRCLGITQSHLAKSDYPGAAAAVVSGGCDSRRIRLENQTLLDENGTASLVVHPVTMVESQPSGETDPT